MQKHLETDFQALARLYGVVVLELSSFSRAVQDLSLKSYKRQMAAADCAFLWVHSAFPVALGQQESKLKLMGCVQADRGKFEDLLHFIHCVMGVW